MTKNKSFLPGALWPDENGIHINAHGGGILFHEGVYYWFGEHKIEGSAGNRAHVGVHVYSSGDLYNWRDCGIALQVSDDPASPISRGCILERPKVIYNARTGKFVMWFHLEPKDADYSSSLSGVAEAELTLRNVCLIKAPAVSLETAIRGKAAPEGGIAEYKVTVSNCTDRPKAVALSFIRYGWEVMDATVEPATLQLAPGREQAVYRECESAGPRAPRRP